MVAEVLEHLAPARGGVFVDCTVGLGGHARALLEAGASRLIGLDRDPAALVAARGELRELRRSRRAGARRLPPLRRRARRAGRDAVDGVLADLGVSSLQLDSPGRGFSFRRDGPLDMRMDTIERRRPPPRRLRDADERTLADVIYRFGEERYSRRIARAIVAARQHGPIDDHRTARRDRPAGGSAHGLLADRSGDAHVPGDAHLGERRARRARRVSRRVARRLERRRANGRDHVPFAGGSRS